MQEWKFVKSWFKKQTDKASFQCLKNQMNVKFYELIFYLDQYFPNFFNFVECLLEKPSYLVGNFIFEHKMLLWGILVVPGAVIGNPWLRCLFAMGIVPLHLKVLAHYSHSIMSETKMFNRKRCWSRKQFLNGWALLPTPFTWKWKIEVGCGTELFNSIEGT